MEHFSEGLKKKLNDFKTSQVINFTPDEGAEFKKFYQQTFRDNVDLSCGLCVASCIKKVIRYGYI